MPSRFQLHVAKWQSCTKCQLHKVRTRTVFCRGELPCDLLFVGEAPGPSEDTTGVPFDGPAGRILDGIVAQAFRLLDLLPQKDIRVETPPLRCAFTNLVLCIPLEEDHSSKFSEPPYECVEACKPRLQEFIAIANPKLIVTVGKCAEGWFAPGMHHSIRTVKRIPTIAITHPAAILRIPFAFRTTECQRQSVRIKNAVKNLKQLEEAAKLIGEPKSMKEQLEEFDDVPF